MNGYTKDWPVLKRMLIDNGLEHAAQLAYGTYVTEAMFTMRAQTAFRRVVATVAEHNRQRAEVMAEVAREVEEMEKEAGARNQGYTRGQDEGKPAEEGGVAVTMDRITDEPPKDPHG